LANAKIHTDTAEWYWTERLKKLSPGELKALDDRLGKLYHYSLEMKPSAGIDQMYQAGWVHYEIWDEKSKTLKLRVCFPLS
jgi:hypothetical protein